MTSARSVYVRGKETPHKDTCFLRDVALRNVFSGSDNLASVHRDLGPDSGQVAMTSLLRLLLFTRAESSVHTLVFEEDTRALKYPRV